MFLCYIVHSHSINIIWFPQCLFHSNVASLIPLWFLFSICNFDIVIFPSIFFLGMESRTYASKYIPIIASVSEHQPPTWPSYFMDINVLAFLVPAGIIVSAQSFTDLESNWSMWISLGSPPVYILIMYVCWNFQACFLPLSDASSFAVLYIVTSVYFSGVMV